MRGILLDITIAIRKTHQSQSLHASLNQAGIRFLSFFLFYHFLNCYSITVVQIFPNLASSSLPLPRLLPQSIPILLSMSMPHSYMILDYSLPLLSLINPLPPTLWSLSVCSLFPCFWFYFALFLFCFVLFCFVH